MRMKTEGHLGLLGVSVTWRDWSLCHDGTVSVGHCSIGKCVQEEWWVGLVVTILIEK